MTTVVGVYTTNPDEKRGAVIAADGLEISEGREGEDSEEECKAVTSKIWVGKNFVLGYSGKALHDTTRVFLNYISGNESLRRFLKEIEMADVGDIHPSIACLGNPSILEKLAETGSIGDPDPVRRAVDSAYFFELALLNAYHSGLSRIIDGQLEFIIATNYDRQVRLYNVNTFGLVTTTVENSEDAPIISSGSGEDFVRRYIESLAYKKNPLLKDLDLNNLGLKEAKLLALSLIEHVSNPCREEFGDPLSGFEADLVVVTPRRIVDYRDILAREVGDFRRKRMLRLANKKD